MKGIVTLAVATSRPLDRAIDAALLGAVYPLDAGRLVRIARENGAPPMVLTLLGQLGSAQWTGLRSVQRAIDRAFVGLRRHGWPVGLREELRALSEEQGARAVS